MLDKYFKPKSLTWWCGIVSLATGAFIASESIHGLQSVVATIAQMSDGMEAAEFIVYGLTVIGLRGAFNQEN